MQTSATNGRLTVAATVLSFNRPDHVRRTVEELVALGDVLDEILVVDNASEVPCAKVLADFPNVIVIRTARNEGTSARNHGILRSSTDVIVTLDDDVSGLTESGVVEIRRLFNSKTLGCVNFAVKDRSTGATMNWMHPYPQEQFADRTFVTCEISEGAAAFSRRALLESGLYPDSFFISHEGPDLACRILDRGYEVTYNPSIKVFHQPAQAGRPSWRRYYFDTRNIFWFAARNLPLFYALKKISLQSGAMLIFAIRDGFVRYWFKAVFDGICGLPQAIRERRRISAQTLALLRNLDRTRPTIAQWVRTRLFRRGVQI